jgi:hypothetical protein
MKVTSFMRQNVDAHPPLPDHLAAHAHGRPHARPRSDEQEQKAASADARDENAG